MRTTAELLLAAEKILRKSDGIVSGESFTDTDLAKTALALKLKERGLAFALRAISEEWDLLRVVREIY